MTPFMLYCWQMLDGVCSVFRIITCISFIISAIYLIFYVILLTDGKEAKIKPAAKIITPILVISTILSVLTPTTKQAAIIFGVPMMLNQAKEIQADKVPAKLIEYLNLYLDEEIAKKKKN